jgi:hypothetical protein
VQRGGWNFGLSMVPQKMISSQYLT